MTQQLALIPPDVTRGTWHAFSADHDRDDAKLIYQQRYGRPPQHIILVAGRIPQLWLGPIPGANHDA